MNQAWCLLKIRTELEIPRKATYSDQEKARIFKNFAHLSEDDFVKLIDLVLDTHPHRTLPPGKCWKSVYKDNQDKLTPKISRVKGECNQCDQGLRRFWCTGTGGFDKKEYIAACRCSCINGENWSKAIPLDSQAIGHPRFIKWYNAENEMDKARITKKVEVEEPVVVGADIDLTSIGF